MQVLKTKKNNLKCFIKFKDKFFLVKMNPYVKLFKNLSAGKTF